MGHIKLLDLIGIDISHDIITNLQNYQPNKFQISHMIKEMKDKKMLGKRQGTVFILIEI